MRPNYLTLVKSEPVDVAPTEAFRGPYRRDWAQMLENAADAADGKHPVTLQPWAARQIAGLLRFGGAA